jgi:hypothetical protein
VDSILEPDRRDRIEHDPPENTIDALGAESGGRAGQVVSEVADNCAVLEIVLRGCDLQWRVPFHEEDISTGLEVFCRKILVR